MRNTVGAQTHWHIWRQHPGGNTIKRKGNLMNAEMTWAINKENKYCSSGIAHSMITINVRRPHTFAISSLYYSHLRWTKKARVRSNPVCFARFDLLSIHSTVCASCTREICGTESPRNCTAIYSVVFKRNYNSAEQNHADRSGAHFLSQRVQLLE